jgi:hypothetical protein
MMRETTLECLCWRRNFKRQYLSKYFHVAHSCIFKLINWKGKVRIKVYLLIFFRPSEPINYIHTIIVEDGRWNNNTLKADVTGRAVIIFLNLRQGENIIQMYVNYSILWKKFRFSLEERNE